MTQEKNLQVNVILADTATSKTNIEANTFNWLLEQIKNDLPQGSSLTFLAKFSEHRVDIIFSFDERDVDNNPKKVAKNMIRYWNLAHLYYLPACRLDEYKLPKEIIVGTLKLFINQEKMQLSVEGEIEELEKYPQVEEHRQILLKILFENFESTEKISSLINRVN